VLAWGNTRPAFLLYDYFQQGLTDEKTIVSIRSRARLLATARRFELARTA
jgi:hypothetical protein